MTLFVDTQHGRGHSGDLGPLLRRYLVPRSLVVDQHLDHGDVLVIGNGPNGSALRIGIEVKRAGDVLVCMEDGRFGGLGGQLEGMHQDYDLSWLVVEDELRPDVDSGVLMKRLPSVRLQRAGRSQRKRSKTETSGRSDGQSSGRFVPALYGSSRTVTYAALMKWTTSMQVLSIYKYGKPLFVWNTKTADETAQWIVSQYRFWTDKEFEAHKSMRLFNTALVQKDGRGRRRSVGFMSEARKRRMAFANVFDGMGYDRAANVSTKFSSIEEMVRATVEELQVKGSGRGQKDGVGEIVAKKMWEQIRERRR